MLAYLDAGSGSLIASLFVGGFAAMAVFFKMQFHRFTGVFSRKGAVGSTPEVTPDAESTEP